MKCKWLLTAFVNHIVSLVELTASNRRISQLNHKNMNMGLKYNLNLKSILQRSWWMLSWLSVVGKCMKWKIYKNKLGILALEWANYTCFRLWFRHWHPFLVTIWLNNDLHLFSVLACSKQFSKSFEINNKLY